MADVITVHIGNMDGAAGVECLRVDHADGRSAILIHDGLTSWQQAAAVNGLLHDGETPEFLTIPEQRGLSATG